MAIVLPTSKIQPTETEPRVLVIFSKPKSGKSTALSLLDNNLILDTEKGTAYIEALKVDVSSVKDILEVCKQVKAAGCPYKYITLDTLTSLEEILQPYALSLWKKSNAYNPEKNPEQLKVTDVYSLPFGTHCPRQEPKFTFWVRPKVYERFIFSSNRIITTSM